MIPVTSLTSWIVDYSSIMAPSRRFNDSKFALVFLDLVARFASICVWLQKANILGLLFVMFSCMQILLGYVDYF